MSFLEVNNLLAIFIGSFSFSLQLLVLRASVLKSRSSTKPGKVRHSASLIVLQKQDFLLNSLQSFIKLVDRASSSFLNQRLETRGSFSTTSLQFLEEIAAMYNKKIKPFPFSSQNAFNCTRQNDIRKIFIVSINVSWHKKSHSLSNQPTLDTQSNLLF